MKSGTSTQSGTRPRRAVNRRALLVLAVIVVAVGWLIADLVKALEPGTFDSRAFFREHRSDLDRVAGMVAEGRLVAPTGEGSYYGPKLPKDLRYLSDTERVSIYEDGALFIPLWTGIPDDAGGFWNQKHSPQGKDMYGMGCRHPDRLAAGWWACGMRAVRRYEWDWVWW